MAYDSTARSQGPGLLRHLPLFADLEERVVSDLSRRLVCRERPAGAVLLSQDGPGDAMYFVEMGRAKVVRQGESGREVTLAHLRAGDLFGEVAALDGRPRSASVVAVTPVRLLILARDALLQHVTSFPQTAIRLMSELCRRLRRADEVIADLALCAVEVRLARTLVMLARDDGAEPVEGALVLRSRPTQAELASMVGTCRETVSRQVAAWQRRGLVSLRGSRIVLSRDFVEQTEAGRRAA